MRDNHPKRRQVAREEIKLQRKIDCRKEKKTVLIVCEGECTEPNYFGVLCAFLGIPNATVEIKHGETGSNAIAIIKRTADILKNCPNDYFDYCFAVVDGDQSDIEKARAESKNPSNKNRNPKIELIITNPCFEFWLLLHFCYSDRPFTNCKEVTKEVTLALREQHIPHYNKTNKKIPEAIINNKEPNRIKMALDNSKNLRKSMASIGSSTPMTDVDKIVKVLYKIAGKTLKNCRQKK